jgi:uncharacterized C2H2 Zn-finger protein
MAPGGRLTTYDVDACQDCAKPFMELAQYLEELGRPVDGGKARKAPSVVDESTPEADRTCPACGFVSVNRTAMRTHLRAKHGQTLARAGQPDQRERTDLTCPECSDVFGSPQGLGAHRSRAHGVAGTSTGATRARKAKDQD